MTMAERRVPYVWAWGNTKSGKAHKDKYRGGEMKKAVDIEEREELR